MCCYYLHHEPTTHYFLLRGQWGLGTFWHIIFFRTVRFCIIFSGEQCLVQELFFDIKYQNNDSKSTCTIVFLFSFCCSGLRGGGGGGGGTAQLPLPLKMMIHP